MALPRAGSFSMQRLVSRLRRRSPGSADARVDELLSDAILQHEASEGAQSWQEGSLLDGRTDVLFELVLRSLLLPEATQRSLLRHQTLEQKRKLIKQHTIFRTHESAAGSSRHEKQQRAGELLGLRMPDSLVDYRQRLAQLAVLLRTADRAQVETFLKGSSVDTLLEAMRHCALRQPKTAEEIEVLKLSLACLDKLTDNRVGLHLLVEHRASLVTLALCVEATPLVAGGVPVAIADECVGNAVAAMDVLIRLGWACEGGSAALLGALAAAAGLRRSAGGALLALALHIDSSPLLPRNVLLLVRLCLQSCTFINSLIELEDDIHRRETLRQQAVALGLLLEASRLQHLAYDVSRRKPWKNNPGKGTPASTSVRATPAARRQAGQLAAELETQLQIFRNRRDRDLEVFAQAGATDNGTATSSLSTSASSASTLSETTTTSSHTRALSALPTLQPPTRPAPQRNQQPRFSAPATATTHNNNNNKQKQGKEHRAERLSTAAPSRPVRGARARRNPRPPPPAPVPSTPTSQQQPEQQQQQQQQAERQRPALPPRRYKVQARLEQNRRWREVVQLLAQEHLVEYQAQLREWGFDTCERLALLEEGDLREMGMKRGHARALLRAVRHGSLSRQGGGQSRDQGEEMAARFPQPYAFKVIPRAALVIKDPIGSGSFGDVFSCEYQGATCAVKVVKRVAGEVSVGPLTNAVVLEEAKVMEVSKNHPHVVNLYGVCLDAYDVMLVSEFCERGSLHDVLVRSQQPLALAERLRMARQGVSGLVHLHSLNVVHRDIAARNFLVTGDGTVKVCDFGLAKIKTSNENASHSGRGVHPLRWAAPESLAAREYSRASDVFMCGVFLWEVWMRSVPFPGMDNIQAALRVVAGARPEIPDAARADLPILTRLLESCWLERPVERPTMSTVMGLLGDLLQAEAEVPQYDQQRDLQRRRKRHELALVQQAAATAAAAAGHAYHDFAPAWVGGGAHVGDAKEEDATV